jgi:hypothetical protein
MLAFAARARGFPCEPRDPARPTVAEIKAFQKAYNDDFGKSIAVDGSVGNQTRGAYFDVVEAELVLQAGGKQTLDSLRAELRFVDAGKKSVACGERFPLDRAEQDGVASQTNRRVELVFFGESRPGLQGPDPAEEIYGEGNFAFERVDPETLEAIEESPAEDQLALADAPPPEDGAGDMNGPLTTEMAKLQDAPELADQYAFLTPFDEAFPDAGAQSVGDFPIATGDSVLV